MPHSRGRQAKSSPVSVPEPWVCWKNNKLDFREHDIIFTVKAAKRIEAILIHHYDIEKRCEGKEQNLMNIIDRAKGDVAVDVVDKLHEFRMMRNSLVHDQDCDQLGKAKYLRKS